MVKVRVLGTFAISEIIAICSLPFVQPMDCIRKPWMRTLMIMVGLWLAGVIIANTVNESSVENSLKGAFNVIFLLGSIPFIYWILKDDVSRVLYFWAGLAISSIVAYYYPLDLGSGDPETDYFRIYAYLPAAVAISGLLYYYGYKWIGFALCICFGVYALFQNSRHIFLIMNIVVALAVVYYFYRRHHNKSIRFSLKMVSAAILTVAVTSGLSYWFYSCMASDGTLGDYAKEKYEMQSSSRIGIFSGRRDFLISLYAVSQNPIIGYGSYAEDEQKFTEKVIGQIEDPGNAHRFMYPWQKKRLIKGHSYILGAWVYAGILGFAFWAYVLGNIALFLKNNLLRTNRMRFFLGVETAFMLWNILFSPFSDRPVFAMYFISVLIIAHCSNQQSKDLSIS